MASALRSGCRSDAGTCVAFGSQGKRCARARTGSRGGTDLDGLCLSHRPSPRTLSPHEPLHAPLLHVVMLGRALRSSLVLIVSSMSKERAGSRLAPGIRWGPSASVAADESPAEFVSETPHATPRLTPRPTCSREPPCSHALVVRQYTHRSGERGWRVHRHGEREEEAGYHARVVPRRRVRAVRRPAPSARCRKVPQSVCSH